MIELEKISYDYISKAGVVHALKEVTVRFCPGKMHAVMGRSGSGKSTLMSVIAGLYAAKTGCVRIRDVDLFKTDREKFRRENIGMIFQSYYLLPQLTVEENILLPLDLNTKRKGMTKKQALEYTEILLAKVGLPGSYRRKLSTQLSGGEQQRVAIARAIANDPPIILADEPTGNLDNENSANIIALLRDMAHEENKCVVVVTHSDEVASAADCIYRMSDGHLEKVEEDNIESSR